MGKKKGKKKDRRVRITQGQGNLLLALSGNLSLPKELGEGDHQRKYNVGDQGLAAKHAGLLYDELKGVSDLYQSKKLFCFGPGDNWKKSAAGAKEEWTLIDPAKEVKILINKEIRQGAFWSLLMALHPAGSMLVSVHNQADMAWPLADRLGLRSELEKEMGIDKVKDRSFELDDNKEFEEEEEEDEGDAEEETEEKTAAKTEEEAGKKAEVEDTVPV